MKVLIISHNPISTKHNMGKTLLSLFSDFEKDELCQLYIYPSFPDTDKCSSYYRVTDKEALSAVMKGKKPGGEVDKSVIDEEQGLYEIAGDEKIYRNKKNKSPMRRLLRDGVWKLSGWNGEALDAWLEKEKPDRIFVAPGPACFLYDFALEISEKLDIPIVTYICDENYFVKEPRSILGKTRLNMIRKKIKELLSKTKSLVVICDELKEIYEKEFGTETFTIMTGSGYPAAEKYEAIKEPKSISYFGNIRCNRFVSLCEIGKTLDRINEKNGADYRLKIYTAEKDSGILGAFSGIKSVELCGFVKGEDFEKAFSEAEILLHTEAFDEASIDYVRHSVSTKIADSLASGKTLFAYGPTEVSSMKYLIKNGCAIAVSSKEDLEKALVKVFLDENARKTAVEKALAAAKNNHDRINTGKKIRRIMEEAVL